MQDRGLIWNRDPSLAKVRLDFKEEMKNLLKMMIVVTAFLLADCADSQLSNRLETSNTQLKKDESIYISLCEDGAYGNKIYKGSGRTTTQIIRSEILKKSITILVSFKPESLTEAMESAKV